MKRIINLFLILIICFANILAYASEIKSKTIDPENNQCIKKTEVTSIKKEKHEFYMLPLRSALEAVGAKVTWDGARKSIGIDYNGEKYIATLDYINGVDNTINICKSKYIDYHIMDLSIQLSPWGGGSFYEIIDDSTYIDDVAMIRLFYYFGYYININTDNNTFNIITVNEESDRIYKEWYSEKFQILEGIDTEAEGLILEAWCCNEYSNNYDAFNIISYSSKRLKSGDLEIQFEFTYNDKSLEEELENKNIWEISNNKNILNYFKGKKIYKRVKNENVLYDYYVIECDDYYAGYSIAPKVFL